MDPPRRSSRLRHQEPDVASDRREARRPAVAQMMAENREGLGMKVIAIMVQRYGVLPRELRDLNRNSIPDMGAERGITYIDQLSEAVFERIISSARYSIVTLTISKEVSHKIVFPKTLRILKMMTPAYKYPLGALPANLQELVFECPWDFHLSERLTLPNSLRKLKLWDRYDIPLPRLLPPNLVDLELGSAYNHPITLPPCLRRLAFHLNSYFNFPLLLPPSLTSVLFGRSYDHPTLLPAGIEELRFGSAYSHEVYLSSRNTTLRKIVWCCSRPIQFTKGVREVEFHSPFDQPVNIPMHLKKATFAGSTHSYPVRFQAGLEELIWRPKNHKGLALPKTLLKLTWASPHNVKLPSGLKELVLESDVALVLPKSLRKITFNALAVRRHYALPEAVQEVVCAGDVAFTHPSTLQHLILRYGTSEVDLHNLKIDKLTIGHCDARIKEWPQGLKELAFTVDDMMKHPLRVPKGCRIVGEKRPANVIME